jgi:hypothetical protein
MSRERARVQEGGRGPFIGAEGATDSEGIGQIKSGRFPRCRLLPLKIWGRRLDATDDITGGARMSAWRGRGAYRSGRGPGWDVGRFPVWAGVLPRNLFYFLIFSLFSFLFLFETFGKPSKLIQIETKNL